MIKQISLIVAVCSLLIGTVQAWPTIKKYQPDVTSSLQPWLDVAAKYQQGISGALAMTGLLLVLIIIHQWIAKPKQKTIAADYIKNDSDVAAFIQTYIHTPEQAHAVEKRINQIDIMRMKYRKKFQLQELLGLYSRLSRSVFIGLQQYQNANGLSANYSTPDRDAFQKAIEYQHAVGETVIHALSSRWSKETRAQIISAEIDLNAVNAILATLGK